MIRRLATAAVATGALLMSAIAPAAAAGGVQVPPHDIRVEVDNCQRVTPDLGQYKGIYNAGDFEVTKVTGPLRATGEEDDVMSAYITVCAEGEGEGTVEYTTVRQERTLVGTINVEAYVVEVMVEEPVEAIADEDGHFSFSGTVTIAGGRCEWDENVWDLDLRSSRHSVAGRLADSGKGAVIECTDDRYWRQTVTVLAHVEAQGRAAQDEAARAEEEARAAAEAEAQRAEVERAMEEARTVTEAPTVDVEEPAGPATADASEPVGTAGGRPIGLVIAAGLLVAGGAGYFVWRKKTS